MPQTSPVDSPPWRYRLTYVVGMGSTGTPIVRHVVCADRARMGRALHSLLDRGLAPVVARLARSGVRA